MLQMTATIRLLFERLTTLEKDFAEHRHRIDPRNPGYTA
jgi:hypothetical protein